MNTQTINLGPIHFRGIGKTTTSLFAPFGKVTRIHFHAPSFGAITYYDDEVKWSKETQLQLHKDIQDAQAGLNSGWFVGLKGSKKMTGDDIYIQATAGYKLLTKEQAEQLQIS